MIILQKWFYYPDKLELVFNQLLSGDMLIYACLEKDGGELPFYPHFWSDG